MTSGSKVGALAAAIAGVVVMPLVVIVMWFAESETAAASCDVTGATSVNAPIGPAVEGQLRLAVANIPNRTGGGGFQKSMKALADTSPDFIVLNEVGGRSSATLTAGAPGYVAYRDTTPDKTPGAVGQANNNAVLFRKDAWTKVDGGRTRVVDDDHTYYGGRQVNWDRYATWTVLKRTNGDQVAVVSLHMMTNPAKYPRQWGNPPTTRVEQYSHGMDTVVDLVNTLAAHGPVLLGGDMNSHPKQGAWTAASKMKAAGYDYVKDNGVMYAFYPRSAKPADTRQLAIASDHPAVVTTLAMNGTGPTGDPSAALPSGDTANINGDDLGLNADQLKNARLVVSKGIATGGKPAAIVGVTTALTESGLSTNPGSLGGAYGLFQQTPPGWGTKAQVMDPQYATTKFYAALAKIPGWQTMQPWHAAQQVQRSGAGDANKNGVVDPGDGKQNFGKNLAQAERIVAALGGDVVDASTDGCPSDGGIVNAGAYKSGGSFKDPAGATHVGPYTRAQLLARMEKFIAANGTSRLDPFFASQHGSWLNACQHFVANLSGRAYSGYHSATVGWNSMVSRGVAHLASAADGMSPPPGAWLYYDNSGPYGHVVVYLGNNQVAGTDTWGKGRVSVGPASDLTGGIWNVKYLGWSAPWGEA